MRLRSAAAAVIALTAAAALTLTGCGSSDNPTADHPDPTIATPTMGGTPKSTPGHNATPTPTQTEGDGDSEGDDTPATAGGGICGELEAADVGEILGSHSKGAALPGGGCGFTQTAAKGASATFIERSAAKTPGGMAGAKTEATSSVEGNPQELSGIGDAAFVVTGTAFGEPAIQGAGAVRIGNRIINVAVTQNTAMSRSAVKAMMIRLLRLAAARA